MFKNVVKIIFRKRLADQEIHLPALFFGFIILLIALTFTVYTALTISTGCSSCPKLEPKTFNLKIWLPAIAYCCILFLNIAALFLKDSEKRD